MQQVMQNVDLELHQERTKHLQCLLTFKSYLQRGGRWPPVEDQEASGSGEFTAGSRNSTVPRPPELR